MKSPSQDYDPCNLKDALRRQGKILTTGCMALLGILAATIAVFGIVFFFMVFEELFKILVGAAIIAFITFLVGLLLYLIFHPVIGLAWCQVKRKVKSNK